MIRCRACNLWIRMIADELTYWGQSTTPDGTVVYVAQCRACGYNRQRSATL